MPFNVLEVIQTDRQTGRRTDRQAGRQTDRQTDRETDRQTDRETDRQGDRQTDRETDRQSQLKAVCRICIMAVKNTLNSALRCIANPADINNCPCTTSVENC
jgi:hypothetical protein